MTVATMKPKSYILFYSSVLNLSENLAIATNLFFIFTINYSSITNLLLVFYQKYIPTISTSINGNLIWSF